MAWYPSELVYGIMGEIAFSLSDETNEVGMPMGIGLLVLMMGRGAAWSIASIPAGIGQGIALHEKKVIINGVVGAVLGGLVGGLLFDPIYLAFLTEDGNANISRAVGFTVIGLEAPGRSCFRLTKHADSDHSGQKSAKPLGCPGLFLPNYSLEIGTHDDVPPSPVVPSVL